MTTLDDAERMAIDNFLASHWAAFCAVASDFLNEDEIEALGEKLSRSE